MAVSFIHAADLHLDSPFVGIGGVDGDVGALLYNATFSAFDNIVEQCLRRRVDFLLVAGDVYDGADRSLRAQLAFRDGLRKLAAAGIRSYVVHGNHDPVDGWSSSLEWPAESHLFGASGVESVTFERGGTTCATIHGISFANRDVRANLASQFAPRDPATFHIGLLHCNVGRDTGHEPYAPCALDDLVGRGVDYWALGHVHAGGVLRNGMPCIVYAGNSQGRHVNELGPRGCYFVRVSDDKDVQADFVTVDAVRWARESVGIDRVDSEEELLESLRESVLRIQANADGRPCLCRLVIGGRGPLHATLRRPNYVAHLRDEVRAFGRSLDPLVWVDAIDVQTRPAVNLDERRKAQDVLGDCLRLAEEYRGDSARRAGLMEQLKSLYGHSLFSKFLKPPGNEELLSILSDAEVLCLDKLCEEGDS